MYSCSVCIYISIYIYIYMCVYACHRNTTKNRTPEGLSRESLSSGAHDELYSIILYYIMTYCT